MKLLKKTCVFILIITVVFAVLFPATALAAGNNKIYSDLTLLTSTNPEVVYTSAPTADYTTTLIADSNFGVTLPDSIVVQKIRFNQFVNSTYQRNVDYTYDENTGAIVIPVATIAGIVYEGSDYDIRIRAGGIPSGAYVVSVGVISSNLIELGTTTEGQGYLSVPTDPFTATLTAAPGFRLPDTITVQRLDTSGGATYPSNVVQTYSDPAEYTYNSATGGIVIPPSTIAHIAGGNPAKKILITASGVKLPTFNITVTQGANGTISPATANNIPQGSDLAFTIAPNSGFQIADVLVDGTSVGAVSSYTFTNITSSHTIAATFSATSGSSTFDITVTQGANGTISPATATNLTQGSNFTFTIAPNSGFQIADVLVDGISVGAVSSYTFTNITSNHTIAATFSAASGPTDPSTFDITVTQSANGTISPGTTIVSDGDSLTFTITPDPGFQIADVLIDGKSVGARDAYTFMDIRSNHTITAKFASALSASKGSLDDIPKTGDSSLLWFWWLLSGVSAAGLAVIIAIWKKASLNR